LYMQAIKGNSLKEAWSGLGDDDYIRICRDIRNIFDATGLFKHNTVSDCIGEHITIPICYRVW
jgi:hypothetical protein